MFFGQKKSHFPSLILFHREIFRKKKTPQQHNSVNLINTIVYLENVQVIKKISNHIMANANDFTMIYIEKYCKRLIFEVFLKTPNDYPHLE